MRDLPVEIVAEYACEDPDVTLQLADKIEPDLVKRGVAEVCYDVECPLIPVLVDICLLYTSPSPRDLSTARMPSSA